MKKIKRSGEILIGTLIAIVSLNSCKKKYVEPVGSAVTTAEDLKTITAPATWRIYSFQWHDKSDNTTFVEYNFQFRADGVIIAIHRNITEYGKWSLSNNIFQMKFNSDLLNEI